ncbi:hypothetical protein J6590_039552 [Homalodisca vitripennis]|nr:hypothetical protein J6590_039552 [Homalodisca vitripennis]
MDPAGARSTSGQTNFHSRNEQNYDNNSSACSESDDEVTVIEIPTWSIITTGMRPIEFVRTESLLVSVPGVEKIQFVVGYVNDKMRNVYYHQKELSLDEAMYIKGNRHKFGVKLYTLTEHQGFILRFLMYTGKSDTTVEGCPTPFEGLFGARPFSVYGLSMKQVNDISSRALGLKIVTSQFQEIQPETSFRPSILPFHRKSQSGGCSWSLSSCTVSYVPYYTRITDCEAKILVANWSLRSMTRSAASSGEVCTLWS